MADLTDTNQNDNSKIIDSFNNPDNFDTYKTMSANISKFGTVSTMLKVGGKSAPIFTGAQVIFEMLAEGPVKGFFTGAASVGGGAFGMGWGAVEGAKETWSNFRRTNNPINLINPLPTIMNMWKYSNKYSDIANIRTSIGYDLIGNSFKKLFGRDNSLSKSAETAAGLAQSISANVLNKDLSSNLKGGATSQAASIASQSSEAAKGLKLSAYNAYTHPEVNTDVTQRVLTKNGDVASPARLEGSIGKTDLAIASDPSKIIEFKNKQKELKYAA